MNSETQCSVLAGHTLLESTVPQVLLGSVVMLTVTSLTSLRKEVCFNLEHSGYNHRLDTKIKSKRGMEVLTLSLTGTLNPYTQSYKAQTSSEFGNSWAVDPNVSKPIFNLSLSVNYFNGNRPSYVGNRLSYVGNRLSYIGNPPSYVGNWPSYVGNVL